MQHIREKCFTNEATIIMIPILQLKRWCWLSQGSWAWLKAPPVWSAYAGALN